MSWQPVTPEFDQGDAKAVYFGPKGYSFLGPQEGQEWVYVLPYVPEPPKVLTMEEMVEQLRKELEDLKKKPKGWGSWG